MLLDQAFELLLKFTGADEALLQNEGIIGLQQRLGLPSQPSDDFDSIYVHTLLVYAVDASKQHRFRPLLPFFRHSAVRQFIQAKYYKDAITPELEAEIQALITQKLEPELAALGIDRAAAIRRFGELFDAMVKRTLKPKDIRQERTITRQLKEIRQQTQVLQTTLSQGLQQIGGSEPAALTSAADFPLVHQVKAWFNALDYGEDNYSQTTEDCCEWMITIPARRGFDRILVRCVDGEASPTDVEALYTAVTAQTADEGWLVYNRRISKTALALLDERQYRDLFSYTLDELIDQAADFTNYIDWLEKEVVARGIDTGYVQLTCKKDDIDLTTQRRIGTSRYGDAEGGIEGYVDGWLEDEAKEHLSVLGEFGTGKTWFSFHYAWLTLQKYQQTKAEGRLRSRLPLVIPLRDYAKALDVENVIAGFFFSQHNMRISSKVFSQLNRMGKLLLIFDGFDEMAARVDKQAMINNFWELAKVVGPGAKAILTCRTEHFPDAKQGRELLSAELKASTKNLTGEPPEFEVLELEKFNESQIRTMLSNKTDGAMVEQVMGNAKLMELAERPVMVDLILDALPKIESLDQVSELNMSRVYLYAVTQRLEKDQREQRTFTSLADKLYFLCEVSWEMLQTDQMSLHFRAFPERLQRLFGDKVREQKDLDHWHYDMMGQAMLVRDDEGNYRPAHRSLLEFFAAYKIVASLGVIEPEFLEIMRRQSHVDEHTERQEYTWEEYFDRQGNEQNTPIPIAPLQSIKTSSFNQLISLIGKSKLAKAVFDLAYLMLFQDTMQEQLLPLIQQTRGRTFREIGYVGSNLAQLMLKRNNRSLEQVDLSRTLLPEMNFASVSLRNTSLRQAQLTNSLFTKTISHVYSVTFSPDGRLLALGDVNGTVQLWDTQTYQVTTIQNNHNGIVWSITFSPDGQLLATSSDDRTVRLWSIAQQTELAVLIGHKDRVSSVSFSPDGRLLATSSDDRTVRLWSVAQQTELVKLTGHKSAINAVSFSPDGTFLATGGDDKTVRLWSVSQQSELTVLTRHEDRVLSVSFSPDGKLLASGSDDKTVRLWSVSQQTQLAVLTGHEDRVLSVSFSPDGTLLATGSYDKTVRLWSVIQQTELVTLTGHEDRVWSVAFSPDGCLLATGSGDRTVKLWLVDEQTQLTTLSGHDLRVWAVAFSPDGQTLAIGSNNQTVKLWVVSQDQQVELTTLAGLDGRVWAVAFSPDGQTLAIGSGDKLVKLWSVSEHTELATLTGHGNPVHSISFSPNGEILATCSSDTTVKLWSVSEQIELATLTSHTREVNSVAFSPDGLSLATCSSDTTVKLWSVSEQIELATLTGHTGWVTSVSFSPDGQLLATCGDDNTVRLWSIADRVELAILKGHQDRVWSVVFSPDGKLLASGSGDKTAKLWSVERQVELRTLKGHRDEVNSVSFSLDGNILATGSNDKSTRLWSIRSGHCITVLDDRLCAGLDITDAIGLTDAQHTTLQLLGAVDHNQPSESNTV